MIGLCLVVTTAVSLAGAAVPVANDTIRVEVGSSAVDGRVYLPHSARVRVWVGPGAGRMRGEWTNVLTVGDSAGRQVHRWVTRGRQVTPAGDSVTWTLRQTYDARTLVAYGIARTASNGARSSLQIIDGRRVRGTRQAGPAAPVEAVDYTIDRAGFVASASDLVPLAVGFKPGRVIMAPIWGPNLPATEQRVFTILGKTDVDVEGTMVNAWKVEEHRQADAKLLATWYLTEKSPYMVYGEVPLPDGSIQRMTEVEVPVPPEPPSSAFDNLGWLVGCWEMTRGSTRTIERWQAALDNQMVGHSRTTVNGADRESERLRLFVRGDTVVYESSPSGQRTAEFRTTSTGQSEVVFANPAHDFPQRIIYRRISADSIVARIEGDRNGRRNPVSFPYKKVACG